MYDAFSRTYDLFVNWSSRLAYELPFIEETLQRLDQPAGRPGRLLDAACGTGWHAIALVQKGWQAAGADSSAGMIEQARRNALAARVEVPFIQAGFTDLVERTHSLHEPGKPASFEALLCLGNSLPHLLDEHSLHAALDAFAACLAPGGLLMLQNRNFDLVLQERQRWMEPQSHRSGEVEWLFLRFYDFLPNGLIDFHILTLQREETGPWHQSVHTTRLRPLLQADLTAALQASGFADLHHYGDMQGAPFDPHSSGNLVVVGRKR